MSTIIPDPNDDKVALRDDGKVMYAVYTRSLDADGNPIGEYQFLGWHDPEKFKIGGVP